MSVKCRLRAVNLSYRKLESPNKVVISPRTPLDGGNNYVHLAEEWNQNLTPDIEGGNDYCRNQEPLEECNATGRRRCKDGKALK